MKTKKEKNLDSSFKYYGDAGEYNFQMKKKPNLWWLLLLLLPLVLLIPLRKDITVYTRMDGASEPYVDVSMNYTARYLLWDKKFNVKVPYDTIQQTDSVGKTVFKRVGYSVYSFIFHFKTPVMFSAGGNECYDSISKSFRFHTTRKVVLDLSPKVADVRLKVVDKDGGFVLPGALVECEYEGRNGLRHSIDTADASGCVVVRDAKYCGSISTIHASADGYADTLYSNKLIKTINSYTEGYPIPLKKDAQPELPTKNCGVHFSGGILSDKFAEEGISIIFENDPYGEYVGSGYYPENAKAFPNAVEYTFDAIAVDKGTRLILYRLPNFEGDVLLDIVGPMLITNVKWIDHPQYNAAVTKVFYPQLQALFPPSCRQWSFENMHEWSNGSCRIICE